MTADPAALFAKVDGYVERLYAAEDAVLADVRRRMASAGLPSINVSASQGKLLYLLAKLAGARRILEIGTLGGYSGVWLARALPADGRLVTLELDPRHAAVARESFAAAGLADRVEVRLGPALDSLAALHRAGGPPFDLVFIDADKPAYPAYLEAALQLSKSGTLILADNVVRGGAVADKDDGNASLQVIRAFNQSLADHPRLESLVLPLIRQYLDGVALAIVR